MRNFTRRERLAVTTALIVTGFAAAAGTASSAFAQASGEPAIEEIVVTSQRREQRLQDVPAAVTAIGGDTLKTSGAVSSRDLQHLAPNVDITRIQSNSNPRIFIRGVGSTDSFAGGNPAVATYVDDVVVGSISGNTFGLFDLERVEVLRGPQGTLYGRNATAGALNYLSRQPGFTPDGYLTLGYGNFDHRNVEGAVTVPLVEGKLTMRVAGSYQARDGTVLNTATGEKNLGDNRFWGARGILRYTPTDELDISLTLRAGKSDPHSVAWKALASRTPGAPTTSCSPSLLASGGCVDSAGRSLPDPYNPDVASLNYAGRETLGNTGGNLKVSYRLPFATLTSITGVDRFTRRVYQDLDGSANTVQHYFFDWDTHTFSQELRLASPSEGRLQWVVGGFYYKFGTESKSFSTQAGLPAPTYNLYNQEASSKAVFGHADFAVTDRLTLLGGLRYTKEKIDAVESAYYFTNPVTNVYVDFPQKVDNSNVSGEAGAKYEFSDDVQGYLTYSRGFRAGTINSAPVFQTVQVNAINPETLDSYEMGLKSQFFDRRVQLNLAAFVYKYKDMQVSNFLNVNGRAVTVTANAATAEIRGAEAEAVVAVARGLTMRGSVGYLPRARFEQYTVGAVNYDGKRLPNSPKWTVNFGGDYTVPLTDSLDFNASANASYRTAIFFAAANDPLVGRPGYWDVSLRAGVSTNDGKWALNGWIKNLTDNRNLVYVTDFSSIYGFYARSYADPQTFGAELTYRY